MGWAGPGWTPICMAAPPLAEAEGEKEAWGSPAPLWGPGSCEHRGLDSSPAGLLSLCTGRHGPRAPGLSPQPHQPLGRRLWDSFLQLLPHLPCVCVCRFPLPACADSVILPVWISGSISQTLLHPEQGLQHWQLAYNLVPAEARESSLVTPVLQLRLPKAPGLQVPQPLLWIQRRLSQRGAPAHLWAAARGRG